MSVSKSKSLNSSNIGSNTSDSIIERKIRSIYEDIGKLGTDDLDARKKLEDEVEKYKELLRAKSLKKQKREEEELADLLHRQQLDNLAEQYGFKLSEENKLAKEVLKFQKDQVGYVQEKIAKITSTITDKLDPIINKYIDSIQSLNAHLVGTSISTYKLTDRLQNALSGQGLVSQEKVYDRLTEYVKSGIVYNVEQRAFLKTIADDIDLVFDGWTTSMNQLVRIQRQDLTANRLALEYSLQGFLNQNYQTSEYIKNSFASISESLLVSQSTMTAQNAMAYEAVVQSWLGSMYSGGANQSTVQNLAKAIDQLGSGDISGIGSGISNLVLMGAARAGLDYGAILNQGLTADTTDKLLAGITSYMSEMGGRESNVVRSQIGKLFGVGITDLIAASNVGNSKGGVSTDISGLLNSFAGFTPMSKRFSNLLDNITYTWGTNIASNPLSYWSYRIENLVANTLGKSLDGIKFDAGKKFFNLPEGMLSVDVGKLLQAAPLITLIPTLLETLATDVGPSAWSRIFGNGGVNGLAGIFNSLGEAVEGTTIKISDMGVSGSAYFGNGSASDLLNNALNNLNSTIPETQVVTQEGPTQEENVSTLNDNVQIIVELLQDHLVAIDNQLTLMGGVSTMVYTYAHDQGVSF